VNFQEDVLTAVEITAIVGGGSILLGIVWYVWSKIRGPKQKQVDTYLLEKTGRGVTKVKRDTAKVELPNTTTKTPPVKK